MKTIFEMSKKDFSALPEIPFKDSHLMKMTSVVIIRTGKMNPSGFKAMKLCAVGENGIPLGIIHDGSDVFYLDGIGGYGYSLRNIGKKVASAAWCIDCIPCGYIRLFTKHGMMYYGGGGFDAEVFSEVNYHPEEFEQRR